MLLVQREPHFFVFAFFLEKKFILLLPFWDKVLLEPQLAWSSDSSCLSFLCTEMTYNTWFFCFTPRSWDYRHVPLGCARPELILPCFLLEYGYVLSLCFFLVVLLLSYLFFFFLNLWNMFLLPSPDWVGICDPPNSASLILRFTNIYCLVWLQ